MPYDYPPRNLGLDLIRATESATLVAGTWLGLGSTHNVHSLASDAMSKALNTLDMRGQIIIGDYHTLEADSSLRAGNKVGNGHGPEMDVVADPIDGLRLLAQTRSGAISVVAIAPKGSMWQPEPAQYMEKLVVDKDVAPALVRDCMEAPIGWTLALIARMKKKKVSDLMIFVLERPRHEDLIEEIRTAGARVMLRQDGDIAGALIAAHVDRNVDALFGVGGVTEGLMAACAVKTLNGAMLGRLAPQSEEELKAIMAAGLDTRRILTVDELVAGDQTFFAATGITDGPILKGVRFHGSLAQTQSIILRGETKTRRVIFAEHNVG